VTVIGEPAHALYELLSRSRIEKIDIDTSHPDHLERRSNVEVRQHDSPTAEPSEERREANDLPRFRRQRVSGGAAIASASPLPRRDARAGQRV
jgi:hypothetical protein